MLDIYDFSVWLKSESNPGEKFFIKVLYFYFVFYLQKWFADI